jgi:hypothetical protein
MEKKYRPYLTLTLFNEGEQYKQYPVAMGKYESPP